jgi:hypothetical protein
MAPAAGGSGTHRVDRGSPRKKRKTPPSPPAQRDPNMDPQSPPTPRDPSMSPPPPPKTKKNTKTWVQPPPPPPPKVKNNPAKKKEKPPPPKLAYEMTQEELNEHVRKKV